MEEWKERQEAELEFVQSAYGHDEAWCESNGEDSVEPTTVLVHRRLDLAEEDLCSIIICLTCRLPPGYPVSAKLEVSSVNLETTTKSSSSPTLRKSALDALPNLLAACRQVALEDEDVEEALFLVFSRAEEWIQEEWPNYAKATRNQVDQDSQQQQQQQPAPFGTTATILGRRLIYSHHIISKIKRADIKRLASDFQLTGYMKIGWPGLIIIEGAEQDCLDFYDEIRPWQWKYLVVRGEQQERCCGRAIDENRKFEQFLEVDDMSLVARHCREVGLEPLFRTSMKVYTDDGGDEQSGIEDSMNGDASSPAYAALIHVDHMNDGKGYRKWLRKTSQETGCDLWIKQFYANDDYTNRPTILVGISARQQQQQHENVSSFLKRWRTSRVDVDSKGKPCLERKMTVLVEGNLEATTVDPSTSASAAWENNRSEGDITDSKENVAAALERLGGVEWRQIYLKMMRVLTLRLGNCKALKRQTAMVVMVISQRRRRVRR
jgi:hypothetical protein